jgi:hypothetical protein
MMPGRGQAVVAVSVLITMPSLFVSRRRSRDYAATI